MAGPGVLISAPVAGQVQLDAGGAARPGHPDVARCRRACPPARSGPATPVVLTRPVGAHQRAHALGHLRGRTAPRPRRTSPPLVAHPEQRLLHLGGVGHHPAAVGRARHRGSRTAGRRALPRSATRRSPRVSPPGQQRGVHLRLERASSTDCMVATATVTACRSRSRTTPCSATPARPPWSAGTARSTGCACRGSTPPPASPRCSAARARPLAARPGDGEQRAPGATSATPRRSRRPTRPTTGACRSST